MRSIRYRIEYPVSTNTSNTPWNISKLLINIFQSLERFDVASQQRSVEDARWVTRVELKKGDRLYTALYNGLSDWCNIYTIDGDEWTKIDTFYSDQDYYDVMDYVIDSGYEEIEED